MFIKLTSHIGEALYVSKEHIIVFQPHTTMIGNSNSIVAIDSHDVAVKETCEEIKALLMAEGVEFK